MKARMESLDMLANNIANSSTTGFKADREFYSLYESELPLAQSQWTDFSQGVLIPSGNPLDIALAGQGFIGLNSPTGTVYTRGGEFQISKSNQLQTADGYTIRNVNDQGKPITVDPLQAIEIDKDGVVRQGGQEIGQMEIVSVDNAGSALKKLGTTYFALMNATPKAAPATEVRQGAIEQSNTPVADQAVKLVSVMRQFEMLQKAMLVGTDMNKESLDKVASVG